MAPGFVEEHGQAHGTMLQEARRRAALPMGGEGSDGVLAHHDPGVREVKFSGGGFKGEDPSEGLSANLVEHVVRVREGAGDDFQGLPVGLALQRRTMPQPWTEASQVVITTRASPT